ncbi:MAG: hypothetical protein ABI921_10850 [Panacibacter sp.]
MEAKRSAAKYWILFFIWLAIMVTMLMVPSVKQFFWLALPGTVTYFSLALDII